MKSVITIGRQYGSGAKDVALMLSSKLLIPLYDRELIEYAANESGISGDILEQYDEKATNSLLYSLSISSYSYMNSASNTNVLPINDRLFISQSEVITKLAEKGPCIILGRCSDYVLRERNDVLNIFLYCDLDIRTKNIEERFGIPAAKAVNIIKKTDKRRASYYNYYTHQKWGDVNNYDIAINSKVGTQKVVDTIINLYNEL